MNGICPAPMRLFKRNRLYNLHNLPGSLAHTFSTSLPEDRNEEARCLNSSSPGRMVRTIIFVVKIKGSDEPASVIIRLLRQEGGMRHISSSIPVQASIPCEAVRATTGSFQVAMLGNNIVNVLTSM